MKKNVSILVLSLSTLHIKVKERICNKSSYRCTPGCACGLDRTLETSEIHNYTIIAHPLLYGNDLLTFFYTSTEGTAKKQGDQVCRNRNAYYTLFGAASKQQHIFTPNIMRCYGVYGIITAEKSLTSCYVFVNRNRTCPATMVLKTRYAHLPSQ